MALFALILFIIPFVLGVITLVYFLGRVFGRRTASQDFASLRQDTDRLLTELDALRSDNLISEAEHEERRKQIVNQFVSKTQIPTP